MWKVWNKIDKINDQSPEEFFTHNNLFRVDDIIFIKELEGVVIQVESKRALSNVYGIDIQLDDADFLDEYDRKLQELNSVVIDYATLFGE